MYRTIVLYQLQKCFSLKLFSERPSPPINLDHSDQTKSSVQLTWEPPLKDGGSPVLGYIVERQEEGTDKWIRCNPKLVPALTFKVRCSLHQQSTQNVWIIFNMSYYMIICPF